MPAAQRCFAGKCQPPAADKSSNRGARVLPAGIQNRILGSTLALGVFLLFTGTAPSLAQHVDPTGTAPKTILGIRNVPLRDGANALLAGDYEKGIELTLQGLKQALGSKEEEAALSNLCAGYLQIDQFDEALHYCEILLARNDESWRAYNNRALIYIKTEQWEKARLDLEKGEALNGGAYTLKLARAMYMDALYPVAPEVEIDDRDEAEQKEAEAAENNLVQDDDENSG